MSVPVELLVDARIQVRLNRRFQAMAANLKSLLIVFGFLAMGHACAQTVRVPESQTTAHWRDVSIDEYRQHLIALEGVVDTCAKRRDTKSCDPMLVGADDRISLVVGGQTEPRLVRYGWLRMLLLKAEQPDEKPAPRAGSKGTKNHGEITVADQPAPLQLLQDARTRLQRDVMQSRDSGAPVPNHAQERAIMRKVLAGRDFRNLHQSSVRDSVLEKVGNWLNRIFASVANLRARSAWVGRAIVWGFILAVCVALVYSLLRLERKWRVRMTPENNHLPGPGAASARDWQLWLEDARRAAGAAQWREAIHFLYWAAISRLESRRLWPADRARTPREYLALVAQEDPRKAGLSELTSTFERFWYGGRAAGESEYRAAEKLATRLIGSGAAAESATAEGGLQ
jgi:hypothetical protein